MLAQAWLNIQDTLFSWLAEELGGLQKIALIPS